MNTIWMLMAQYEGKPIIPVDVVAKDFFDLDTRTFLRKADDGKILLPIVKMEKSQKSAKGVHIRHLAAYLDEKTETAERDMERMHHLVTTSNHFQPSKMSPLARIWAYRFSDSHERCPVTPATRGIFQSISKSRDVPSWRRSWKCKSSISRNWQAFVKRLEIVSE